MIKMAASAQAWNFDIFGIFLGFLLARFQRNNKTMPLIERSSDMIAVTGHSCAHAGSSCSVAEGFGVGGRGDRACGVGGNVYITNCD